MRVIADFSLVPMGVGLSVSRYVAACHEVLEERGISHQLHAYGTNLEGEWEEVFDAIRACHERVHAMGAPRVSTNMRFGTRTDRVQTLQDKVESVTRKLS
ncbi:MAG: MTH1187 family thiamine-binding protein [Deltaproteobacteria bacterium]|nr:MTH1187 family thiamine-binding protein [Deltaproteobacteria bacterium]